MNKQKYYCFARHYPASNFVIILCLIISACSSPQMITRRPAVYNYSEPPGNKVDVTVGVLSPILSQQAQLVLTSKKYGNIDSFNEFAEGFKRNLNEMMVTKGMNIKGPFKDIDEMTYPEKQGSDLVILPEMDFIITLTRLDASSGLSSVTYVFNVSIGGGLLVHILEPLSKEKMWFKRIDFPLVQRNIEIVAQGGQEGLPSVSNAIENAISDFLQDFFNQAMPQVSRYLNADEMKNLKKQSQELREKKRF